MPTFHPAPGCTHMYSYKQQGSHNHMLERPATIRLPATFAMLIIRADAAGAIPDYGDEIILATVTVVAWVYYNAIQDCDVATVYVSACMHATSGMPTLQRWNGGQCSMNVKCAVCIHSMMSACRRTSSAKKGNFGSGKPCQPSPSVVSKAQCC